LLFKNDGGADRNYEDAGRKSLGWLQTLRLELLKFWTLKFMPRPSHEQTKQD